MAEPMKLEGVDIERLLEDESLREWIQLQRWYASKSRSITGLEIIEDIALRDEPPLLLTLVQTRFATGTHELYQLPLSLRRASDAVGERSAALIARIDEWDVYDGLADPTEAVELLRRVSSVVRAPRASRSP
jgi:hypothetical protein